MGVYIKGMEMPKSCGNCFFDTHCDNWRLRNWGALPPDDCPLVPLPPHGRLVDADKLTEEIQLFIKENMLSRDDARELLETIDDAPTIIPAEEGKA